MWICKSVPIDNSTTLEKLETVLDLRALTKESLPKIISGLLSGSENGGANRWSAEIYILPRHSYLWSPRNSQYRDWHTVAVEFLFNVILSCSFVSLYIYIYIYIAVIVILEAAVYPVTKMAPAQTKGATKLREFLADPNKIVVAPGVHDGLTARMALSVGFDALYMVSWGEGFPR